ncbi:Hypp7577 [Branchiostoma lanceolatum]|uniref:Hypp7577 protein n=1 Tax=Branchiostoma lanceolatum TaxID=7740 RepID=A0A8J9Z2C4_BRALA|nr:Hypp7577 [Branchiostoma lanceolatum]
MSEARRTILCFNVSMKYRPEDQEFPPPPPELDGSPKLVPVIGKETPGVQSVQSYPASVKLSPAKVLTSPRLTAILLFLLSFKGTATHL